MRDEEKPTYDVYGVFTVKKKLVSVENVSALDINPDFGFGLDTTTADTPAYSKRTGFRFRKRCIKVMDSSTVSDYRMVRYTKELAKRRN